MASPPVFFAHPLFPLTRGDTAILYCAVRGTLLVNGRAGSMGRGGFVTSLEQMPKTHSRLSTIRYSLATLDCPIWVGRLGGVAL
jgi:hypothetical protein